METGSSNDLGDLDVGQVLEVAQRQHQAILRRQGIEPALHLIATGPHQRPLFRAFHLADEPIALRHPPEGHRLDAPTASAHRVDAPVRADRREPGPQAPVGRIGGEPRVRPQERLLRRVVGIVAVAQKPIAHVVDGPLVTLDQECERLLVTGAHAPHQLIIARHDRRHCCPAPSSSSRSSCSSSPSISSLVRAVNHGPRLVRCAPQWPLN